MAKLNRERALLEKRHRKQARKDARKQAAANPPAEPLDATPAEQDEAAPTGTPALP